MEVPGLSGDSVCPKHGRPRHAFVHEASHAIVAIHHGVDFVSIEVSRELRGEDPDFGEVVGGGLDMGRPPSDWVPAEPARALEILAAGYLAEDTLLATTCPGVSPEI